MDAFGRPKYEDPDKVIEFLNQKLQQAATLLDIGERRLTVAQDQLQEALQLVSGVRVTLDAWEGSDTSHTRFYQAVRRAAGEGVQT